MKNKRFHSLPAAIAAGLTLAFAAIHSQGAITLDSILATDGASAITTTISINGSGVATASPDFSSTGSVTIALNTSFDFTVDAVAAVNTTVGVNYGAKGTNGTIDRSNSGDFGVQDTDGAGTVKTNGIDLNEGFILGINAASLSPALAWQLTGIQLVLVNQPNEIYTIVNRGNTNLSLTGTLPVSTATMIDVTSLGIIVQGGSSNLDAASVFMSSGTADGQNFRVAGFQLEAIPEPSSLALVALGLGGVCIRRKRRHV